MGDFAFFSPVKHPGSYTGLERHTSFSDKASFSVSCHRQAAAYNMPRSVDLMSLLLHWGLVWGDARNRRKNGLEGIENSRQYQSHHGREDALVFSVPYTPVPLGWAILPFASDFNLLVLFLLHLTSKQTCLVQAQQQCNSLQVQSKDPFAHSQQNIFSGDSLRR